MTVRGFKVATFNIRHGLGRDHRVDLGRTADAIGELDADVISLQELDVNLERSGRVDQPAELAQRTGLHMHYFSTLEIDGGSYGIALAARATIECGAESLPRVADEEPRTAVTGRWEGVTVIATHLSRSPRARALQTDAIRDIAERATGPRVIAGDLNEPLRDLTPLLDAGFVPVVPRRRTLGSWVRRPFQIDHILVAGGLSSGGAWLGRGDVSDHAPLVAEVIVDEGAHA